MFHMLLHDNLFSICDSHSLAIFHTHFNKHKPSMRNQLHLGFFRKNMILNVFSCMGSITHNDSFFSICAFHILMFFNIFFRIGKRLFLNYISPFFQFSHNCILQFSLRDHKFGIFRYDKFEGINEGKKVLSFFGKVYHRNEVKGLFKVQDL